jgi:hypothetical protein
MATVTTCDGTGVQIPVDTPTTGIFGHQYSDDARPIAEKYLAELDLLHTEAARAFQAKLDALRTVYRHQLRELPDDFA